MSPRSWQLSDFVAEFYDAHEKLIPDENISAEACNNPLSFRTFAAGNKIKQFYELLVEESLRREDVEMMSRENMKNLHEIMQVQD